MANTDPVEWRLLDDDFTTVLGILPSDGGNLYLELNEPGTGELKIPRSAVIASTVSVGMFAQCLYRGAARGGFFIDNLNVVDANAQEGGGQWLSLSGRGAMAILEDAIIWDDGTGASERAFSGTKASILITLIDEAIARGAITNVNYDFSASVDSEAASWTDSESFSLAVGTSLLDLVRQFADTGIDFNMVVESNGDFTLQAFKTEKGSDLSETVYFRVGTNCEEVSETKLGTKIKNVLKMKYRDGFADVSDSTSITAYRRREEVVNIEAAQSAASATTYGSAKLENEKDPERSLPIRVYDGVTPYAFVTYNIGDYITIDRFGVEASERIRGMQLRFDESGYASIVITLNDTILENDLRIDRDLRWLMDRWNTARDANLLETRTWAEVGMSTDSITSIRCLYLDGDNLYVAGQFTKIGGIDASNIAKYNIATGTWTALATGGALSIFMSSLIITSVCKIGSVIYAAGVEGDIWKLDGTWTLIGQSDEFEPGINSDVLCMATDGTDLYIGGNFVTVEGVANTSGVAKYTVSTGVWSALDTGISANAVNALLWIGSTLYAGGNFTNYIKKFSSGSWSAVGAGLDGIVYALAANGTNVIAGGAFTGKVSEFDESSWAVVGGGVNNTVYGLALYLTDIYAVGDFTDVGNRIARYSGGGWWALEEGLNLTGYAVTLHDTTVYTGGLFTTAGTVAVQKIAAYFTNFVELMNHLGNSEHGYDLGAGIHNATATSAMAAADEIPLWQNATSLLRKITWANILLSIKTYADTLYVALTGNQTIAGIKKFTSVLIVGAHDALYGASGGDIFQNAPDGENPSHIINTWGGVPARVPFVSGGTEGSPTAVADTQVIDQPSVPYTWNGTDYAPAGRFRAVATEDHTTGERGIKWELWACPIGSTTEVLIATFDEDGMNMPTGAAYMVNGTPIGGGGSAPATTAENDFQVGDGLGAWVTKTLAETITILRTSLDGIYAAISHTHGASEIVSGTLDDALLPVPTPTTLGGVQRNTGSAGEYVTGIDASGALEYDTPAGGGGREVLTANRSYYVGYNVGTVTMTIASPCVVTKVAHGLENNDPIVFRTTGALPTGVTQGTAYFVKNKTADTFEISTTAGGASINTSGSQSGTHSAHTGNDSNDGLSTGRAGAFLTIQKAIDVTAALDISIYDVTINVSAGRFSNDINLKSFIGAGKVYITGDTTTPANVILAATWNIKAVNVVGIYQVKGFRLVGTVYGIYAEGGMCFVEFGNMEFGAMAVGLDAELGATIKCVANYSVTGGGAIHCLGSRQGIIQVQSRTVTVSGTPAFSTAFAYGGLLGIVDFYASTVTGAATGKRYYSETNSVIYTNGGGANYFPGNVAGSTATGGQYV